MFQNSESCSQHIDKGGLVVQTAPSCFDYLKHALSAIALIAALIAPNTHATCDIIESSGEGNGGPVQFTVVCTENEPAPTPPPTPDPSPPPAAQSPEPANPEPAPAPSEESPPIPEKNNPDSEAEFVELLFDFSVESEVPNFKRIGAQSSLGIQNSVAYFSSNEPVFSPDGGALLLESSGTNLIENSEELNPATTHWNAQGNVSLLWDPVQASPDDNLGVWFGSNISGGVNRIRHFSSEDGNENEPMAVSLWIKIRSNQLAFGNLLRIHNVYESSSGNWIVDPSRLGQGWNRLTNKHPAIIETAPWKRSSSGGKIGLSISTLQPDLGYIDLSIWGAQLELASSSSSYIPTNGTSVTRHRSNLRQIDTTALATRQASAIAAHVIVQPQLTKPRQQENSVQLFDWQDNTSDQRLRVLFQPSTTTVVLQLVDEGGTQSITTLNSAYENGETVNLVVRASQEHGLELRVNNLFAAPEQLSDWRATLNELTVGSSNSVSAGSFLLRCIYLASGATHLLEPHNFGASECGQ